MSYNIENFFSKNLPGSVSIYSGFPKYNFVATDVVTGVDKFPTNGSSL